MSTTGAVVGGVAGVVAGFFAQGALRSAAHDAIPESKWTSADAADTDEAALAITALLGLGGAVIGYLLTTPSSTATPLPTPTPTPTPTPGSDF